MNLYNIFWRFEPSENPYVTGVINGVPFAGQWSELIAIPGSKFKTIDCEDTDKPTMCFEGSQDQFVEIAINGQGYTSEPYGGTRPPTW